MEVNPSYWLYFSLPVCLAIGGAIGFYVRKRFVDSKIGSAEQKALNIIDAAKKEAETHKKEASLQATMKVRE